jgi:nucleoside-diphosphate-sugar epimerase
MSEEPLASSTCDGPTRVLVTGAAGRLGRSVLTAFAAVGVTTRALVLESDVWPDIAADEVVIGDARDAPSVSRAMTDVDVVVHLAATPSPFGGTAEEVYCGNTAATFTVLEQAGRAGVSRAVIASSHAVSGLPFAVRPRMPAYLPMDEQIPMQVEDPYALSKQADEMTASMMWWRHGLSVFALRFPFLGDPEDRLPRRAQELAADPSKGVAELWSYLDYRDAAQCCVAASASCRPGCHVITLAAPVTLAPYPTEQLLDVFLPRVARRTRFAARCAPFDLTRAREILDFTARFIWPIDERELAVGAQLT